MKENWYRIAKPIIAVLAGFSTIPCSGKECVNMKSATFQLKHGESDRYSSIVNVVPPRILGSNRMLLVHVAEE